MDELAFGVDWDRENQLVRIRHPSGTVVFPAGDAFGIVAAVANAAAAAMGPDKVTIFTPDRWDVIDDPERPGHFVLVLRVQSGLQLGFRIPLDRGEMFVDSIREVLANQRSPAPGSH